MIIAVNYLTPKNIRFKTSSSDKGADLDMIPWGIDIELSINGQVPVKENKKHVPFVCNVQ